MIAYYATHYRHSTPQVWRQRLARGEIRCNGSPLQANGLLASGDRLAWHRPPWEEPAVPTGWTVVFDDGDLHVIDKPAGLPVLPAGGYLEHTLLRMLERRHGGERGGVPRPVHRLGRFTSGLLVCARRPATRAWLSAALRESTAVAAAGGAPPCRKLYRTLVSPGRLGLEAGESLTITTPIGRTAHPLLGRLWCAVAEHRCGGLAARSRLTLIDRGTEADRLEVEITTGRPHQIRIHCAAAGAPLLGDPLYREGGEARPDARPGDGGYRLHAQRLQLQRPDGAELVLEASAGAP